MLQLCKICSGMMAQTDSHFAYTCVGKLTWVSKEVISERIKQAAGHSCRGLLAGLAKPVGLFL